MEYLALYAKAYPVATPEEYHALEVAVVKRYISSLSKLPQDELIRRDLAQLQRELADLLKKNP